MAKLLNLARMTTATTGTGTLTLGSAVAVFPSFAAAGIADGETVTYAIEDGSNSEIGRGLYTSSGTTLTRSVLKSTNSNNAISLSGSAKVFISAAAEDLLFMGQPGGRLTLSTNTPVMTSTVSAATTIYYTPYLHRFVPLYDGTAYAMHDVGGELSQATTDSTKSPAAVTTSSNYDLFVWLDGTTYRCTRGPAWSSATSRGTGAGTTELERVKVTWLNKVSITNGPAANRGTYVGTVRSNGSSQIDFILGGASTAGVLNVWNAYNREIATARVWDTAVSWTYATATHRSLNNSTTNRVSFVDGLGTSVAEAAATVRITSAAGIYGVISLGLDSTSASSSTWGFVFNGVDVTTTTHAKLIGGLGSHYIQALEFASGATATYGGGDPLQNLIVSIKC